MFSKIFLYISLIAALIWLLAVYKVFILDDGSLDIVIETPKVTHHDFSHVEKVAKVEKHSGPPPPPESNPAAEAAQAVRKFMFDVAKPKTNKMSPIKISTKPKQVDKEQTKQEHSIGSATKASKPPSEMTWPPVMSGNVYPNGDGSDIMPITNLEVPRFWFPPEGADWNTVGSRVNGEETIFLMIASYRDFQCRETITSAFQRSDHPERLYIGAVDQIVPGDIGCLDLEIPCEQDPNQMICIYRNQISVYVMDAKSATGPVTARHVGDRMYRGQYYVMQLDAHCLFVNHWDAKIVHQLKSTNNEMAVLSSYLSDVQGSIDGNGDSTRHTRPIMCNSDFEGMMPARYLRHGSQPEDVPEIKGVPQLQPFWAAGFSFSRGHFKLRVPYDAYQPMVFQGEEIAIGIRGFTHGYDFYAPVESVVFHEYAEMSSRRKKIHMFWENSAVHAGEGQKSLKRATSVIGMAPDIAADSWDHSELDRYGLGKVRELSLFYKLFLIDPVQRKAVQLCPFVKTGIMHREFTPYLSSNHLGIDYSHMTDFDTLHRIDTQLERQFPYWEERIKEAITQHNRMALMEAIQNAKRVGMDRKRPELITEAQAKLQSL